jgi:hypothetical protein
VRYSVPFEARTEKFFAPADLAGRKLGRLAAARAFARAQLYFSGTIFVRSDVSKRGLNILKNSAASNSLSAP